MTDKPWPEHTKMRAVQDKSQVIGEFLENTDYILSQYDQNNGGGEDLLWPVTKTTEQILADYFGIDLDKIEAERQQMLAALNTTPTTERNTP